MSINLTKLASSLTTRKTTSNCLAVCEITGIAVSMDMPSMPEGFIFEYKNPLSFPTNFLKFSEQSTEELKKVDISILAGILLALYNYHHLTEDRASAAEKNLLLQRVLPSVLIQSIKFFSVRTKKETTYFPRINLLSEEENKISTPTDMVKVFCEQCRILIEGSPVNESTALIEEADRIYREKRTALQKINGKSPKTICMENLRAGKKLLAEIIEKNNETLSPKLVVLLNAALDSSNYLTLDSELKDKLTKALLKREGNIKCAALARILNEGITSDDLFSIFPKEETRIVEEEKREEKEEKDLTTKEKLLRKLKSVGVAADNSKRNSFLHTEITEELSDFRKEQTEEKGENYEE